MRRNLFIIVTAVLFIACAVGYEGYEENSTMTWDTSNYDSNIRIAHLIDFKGKFIAVAFNFQDSRLIIKSSVDKGVTWITIPYSGTYKTGFNTLCGKTNTLIWFVCFQGTDDTYVFWSTNGEAWSAISLVPLAREGFRAVNKGVYLNDTDVFILGIKTLYDAGGNIYGHIYKIFVSRDKGASWETIYSDNNDDNAMQKWTAITGGKSTPIDNYLTYGTTILYHQFNSGHVDLFVSHDNGKTWTKERLPLITYASSMIYDGYTTIIGGDGTIRADGPDFVANVIEPSKLKGCDTDGSTFNFAQFKPDTFVSPLHFCDDDGNEKTIALVKPVSKGASRFRIKISPDSDYAKLILGNNNDGICALAKC